MVHIESRVADREESQRVTNVPDPYSLLIYLTDKGKMSSDFCTLLY
jgi:hypothetical protein